MACASCGQPLVITFEPDSDEEGSADQRPESVPDDVHLNCGDHFHWQCLLDAYNVAVCPKCSADISSRSAHGEQQVLVNLHNEGGFQASLDILSLLQEEAYLKAYPNERRARAFLEFCRDGDVEAVVDLLDDDEAEKNVLMYQDPIDNNYSALHVAVVFKKKDIAWLLLLLGSDLDLQQVPPQVLREAQAAGLGRDRQAVQADIRALQDAQGRTAEQLAASEGDVFWQDWIGTGRLAI